MYPLQFSEREKYVEIAPNKNLTGHHM